MAPHMYANAFQNGGISALKIDKKAKNVVLTPLALSFISRSYRGKFTCEMMRYPLVGFTFVWKLRSWCNFERWCTIIVFFAKLHP